MVLGLTVRTADGRIFSLGAQQGHWLVVNYWATWCEACREEMPRLSAFAKTHPSVRIIGLTYEDITPASLEKFVAKHPLGYPVARIGEKALPAVLKPTFFGIHALPLTYVVAPNGTVVKRWVGELDRARLQTLAGMLSQQNLASGGSSLRQPTL